MNKSRILAIERRVCSGAPMPCSVHTIVKASRNPGLQWSVQTTTSAPTLLLLSRRSWDVVTRNHRTLVFSPRLAGSCHFCGFPIWRHGPSQPAVHGVPPLSSGNTLSSEHAHSDIARQKVGGQKEASLLAPALAVLCWAPYTHSEP